MSENPNENPPKTPTTIIVRSHIPTITSTKVAPPTRAGQIEHLPALLHCNFAAILTVHLPKLPQEQGPRTIQARSLPDPKVISVKTTIQEPCWVSRQNLARRLATETQRRLGRKMGSEKWDFEREKTEGIIIELGVGFTRVHSDLVGWLGAQAPEWRH